MSVFRPSNINRRLVGTAITNTSSCPLLSGKGSPGNGGQIGPKKTPYLCSQISLGCRCCGGSCGGVFKVNEALCGVKEKCNCNVTDCCAFFICCGPSTTKWFVAPVSVEVSRNWYSNANAASVACTSLGNCGWFTPTSGQLSNPGFSCRSYWDSFTSAVYWSTDQGPTHECRYPHPSYNHIQITEYFNPLGVGISFGSGNGCTPSKGASCRTRAFRCTAT